jgi:hypothetical protein
MRHVVVAVTAAGLLGCTHRAVPARADTAPRPDGRRSAVAVPPLEASRVVGCYALTLGPWSGPFPSNYPGAHEPPALIRLDTTTLAPPFDNEGARQLEPTLRAFAGWRRFPPRWRLLPGDSVQLVWTNGHAGLHVHAAVRGDSLVGLAQAFDDNRGALIVQPSAEARGSRVSCARLPTR